jgi:zinc-binding in reverse transcriptase
VFTQEVTRNLHSNLQFEDEVYWKGNSTGVLTAKSAYFTMKNGPRIKTIKINIDEIWKLNVPPRFKVWAWMMLLNRILTTDNLKKKGWSLVSMCVMCRANEESVEHLFSSCSFTCFLFHTLSLLFTIEFLTDLITAISDTTTQNKTREIILIAHFIIWRERCSRIFRNQMKQNHLLLEEIILQRRLSSGYY